MNKDDITEGPLNTLGTNIKTGLARRRDSALGNFGQAPERLNLRTSADSFMKGWLTWLTRQRYGGAKIEGNADDLRQYIRQSFGDPVLQQLEPTIDRVVPTQNVPVQPFTAPAPTPPTAPVANTQAPQTDFDHTKDYNPDDGMTIPPVPGRNPEVPPWLANQRNTSRAQPTVPSFSTPNRAILRPIRQPQRAESVMFRGKLVEVALQRSQIDTIMRQLAVIQRNSGATSNQPSQTPNPAQPQQPSRQPNQTQSQPQQPSGNNSRINVNQIMGATVTLQGLQKAASMRQVRLSPVDEKAITNALQRSNGSSTVMSLLSGIPNLKAESFVAILYAMDNS